MRVGTFSGGGLGMGVAFTLVDRFTQTSRRIQAEMGRLNNATRNLASVIETNIARMGFGIAGLLGSITLLKTYVRGAKIDAQFYQYQLALQSFVGSAEKAKNVFERIKKDAIENPVFEVDAMMRANTMLISAGISAEQSMRVISNMSKVLAGVGRGNDELMRMGVNMQQIAALGHAMGRDINQFAYAGIDVIGLIADALGKTRGQVTRMDVTVQNLDLAFQKATTSGGKFYKAMERTMLGVFGLSAKLQETTKVMMADLGESIRPIMIAFYRAMIAITEAIRAMLATGWGKWIARIVFGLGILVAVLSTLIVISSLVRIAAIAMSYAYGLATKRAVQLALANGQLGRAYGLLWLSMKKAMIPLLRKFFVLSPIIALFAGLAYVVNRATTEFAHFQLGMSGAYGRGPIAFYQKLGATLKWVTHLMGRFNTSTGIFEDIDPELWKNMEDLGIVEWAKNVMTWLGRLLMFWRGFKDGMKKTIVQIANIFRPANDSFSDWNDLLRRGVGTLEDWRSMGEKFANMLQWIALAWVVVKVQAVAAAIAQAAALWHVYIIIAAILVALWALKGAYDSLKNGFDSKRAEDIGKKAAASSGITDSRAIDAAAKAAAVEGKKNNAFRGYNVYNPYTPVAPPAKAQAEAMVRDKALEAARVSVASRSIQNVVSQHQQQPGSLINLLRNYGMVNRDFAEQYGRPTMDAPYVAPAPLPNTSPLVIQLMLDGKVIEQKVVDTLDLYNNTTY